MQEDILGTLYSNGSGDILSTSGFLHGILEDRGVLVGAGYGDGSGSCCARGEFGDFGSGDGDADGCGDEDGSSEEV